ncbi:condensation domain-containing protein [Streptomyces sp. NBC_01198]|uniref:condensation domain-containing protein n=1 Tax=Streptomyces sp. NBC_01198 TaxID=2903769 RepID=UPI002E153AD9|nr:condensation domain-containing protein [Streptomyces sp. NBC_01198]
MPAPDAAPLPDAAPPVPGPERAPAPSERVEVHFAGDGEGEDEMSWGMWEIWHAMCRQRSALPIGGRAALEPGTTVEDLAGELRYLMGRFPSMRTRLRFDAAGHPTQRLFAAGRITLGVYDAAPGADPDAVAAEVEAHYRRTAFDYAGAWPVRMGAVRQEGRPTHLVTVMHHLVADGLGGAVMLREVRSRETAPVTGMQQLDQARWQRSPAGLRQTERALRHFEGVLRALPERQLPGATDPRTPRHWVAEFRSPALDAALPAIVARTGAGAPAVLLALFALGLHRATGISPVAVRPVVNNRFRPGLSDVVCMVAQAGVCAIEVEGATVEEVVERVRRGSMSVHKHAYFHPERLVELTERLSRERGADVSVGSFFNDRSTHALKPQDDGPSAVPAPGPGDACFRWTAQGDGQTERFFVHADDAPGGGLLFEIRIDTHFVSPAQAHAFAHAMEAAAIEAASAAQAGPGPGAPGEGGAGQAEAGR